MSLKNECVIYFNILIIDFFNQLFDCLTTNFGPLMMRKPYSHEVRKVTGSPVTRLGLKAHPSASEVFESGTFRSRVDMQSHCATLPKISASSIYPPSNWK